MQTLILSLQKIRTLKLLQSCFILEITSGQSKLHNSRLIAIISYSFPIGRTCFIKWMQRFEVGRQNGRQAEAHPLILQLPFNVGSKNFREHVLLSNFRVAVEVTKIIAYKSSVEMFLLVQCSTFTFGEHSVFFSL